MSKSHDIKDLLSEAHDWADHPPFRRACAIVRRLQEAGHHAVIVGGAVRDLILGRPVDEVDVATAAPPETVEALFPRTVAVGRAFGVIVVVGPDGNVEVASFRNDGRYIDGRRPESVQAASEEEDVRRRDFTINALILYPAPGLVIDHVGGLADLEAGLVRAVGDPSGRLTEDRLRALRAIRFTARLGFRLEPATDAALDAVDLNGLSAERILEEWRKGLADPGRGHWCELVTSKGFLGECCPPLANAEDGSLALVRTALSHLPPATDWRTATALLLQAAEDRGRTWLRDWPFSKADRKRIGLLAEACPDAYLAGREADRLRLAASERAEPEERIWRALGESGDRTAAAAANALAERRARVPVPPEPLLDGTDLLAAGCTGPRIGVILHELENLQWEGVIRNESEARAWLSHYTSAR